MQSAETQRLFLICGLNATSLFDSHELSAFADSILPSDPVVDETILADMLVIETDRRIRRFDDLRDGLPARRAGQIVLYDQLVGS